MPRIPNDLLERIKQETPLRLLVERSGVALKVSGENLLGVGRQWELRRVQTRIGALAAPTLARSPTEADALHRLKESGLYAASRTRTGSRRSASRYSIRNGESNGPSPGLPRGGGIAERCAGVRPK